MLKEISHRHWDAPQSRAKTRLDEGSAILPAIYSQEQMTGESVFQDPFAQMSGDSLPSFGYIGFIAVNQLRRESWPVPFARKGKPNGFVRLEEKIFARCVVELSEKSLSIALLIALISSPAEHTISIAGNSTGHGFRLRT